MSKNYNSVWSCVNSIGLTGGPLSDGTPDSAQNDRTKCATETLTDFWNESGNLRRFEWLHNAYLTRDATILLNGCRHIIALCYYYTQCNEIMPEPTNNNSLCDTNARASMSFSTNSDKFDCLAFSFHFSIVLHCNALCGCSRATRTHPSYLLNRASRHCGCRSMLSFIRRRWKRNTKLRRDEQKFAVSGMCCTVHTHVKRRHHRIHTHHIK